MVFLVPKYLRALNININRNTDSLRSDKSLSARIILIGSNSKMYLQNAQDHGHK